MQVMVLYQFAAVALAAVSAIPQDATPTPPTPLGNPFILQREAFEAGNPLPRYLEQLQREAEYDRSEEWRDTYWQARSTLESALGDTLAADQSWDRVTGRFRNPSQILIESPLERFRSEDAVGVVARLARQHRWVMVGEEHVKPQSRSILSALVRALHRQGFRTLAAETFRGNSPDALAKLRSVDISSGTYTVDPVFADGVREAIRLGWRLVPYEAMTQAPADADPDTRQNFRENLQAVNLKTRIFDRDPNAKVLVWAGRAHILETAQSGPGGGQWTPMAYEFKRLTGVDPLSVYATAYLERSERKFEAPLYKWATDHGRVTRPTIFTDADGKPYGEIFDAQVFFPRSRIVRGRPDWLFRELSRVPVAIPTGLVRARGMQLAQAFRIGDEPSAVPIDQVLLRPGDPVPALALPRGSRAWVRVMNAEGKENGRQTVETR